MKKQALLFFALSIAAFGQGVRYDIPPILNSRAALVPNANISLCPGTATITNSTCSPASTQAFTDITLTTPCATGSPVVLPQTNVCSGVADSLGNAGFWLAPGAYIYCINGPTITGKCYNLTVPAGTTSGGSAIIAAQNVSNTLYVGPGAYATVAAAETACGSSQCNVVIQANYAGTDCPATGANTKQNIFHIDYRASANDGPGGQGGTVCTGNTMTFNGSETGGAVHSGFRNIWTFLNPTLTAVGAFNQCFYGGTTLPANSSMVCGASESDLIGNYSSIPSTTNFLAHEFTLLFNSTGGSVNTAYGSLYSVGMLGGNTTNIGTVYGARFGIFNKQGSTATVQSAIGALFDNQTAGAVNNWSFEVQGEGHFDCSQSGQQCLRIVADSFTNRNTLRMTDTHAGGGDWLLGDGTCGQASVAEFEVCNLNVGTASYTALKNTGTAGALLTSAPSANRTYTFPDQSGTVAVMLTATSAAFATATTAGTCVQNTTAVAGAATTMAVAISPVSTPGVGAVWSAFVSSAGNVTINECAVATSAGGTIAFNIRVFP